MESAESQAKGKRRTVKMYTLKFGHHNATMGNWAEFPQGLLNKCVQCVLVLPMCATEVGNIYSPFLPLNNELAMTHSFHHASRLHLHEYQVVPSNIT